MSTRTFVILPHNARPIDWDTAKEEIKRFLIEIDNGKYEEPLAYVFPIGSMLFLLENLAPNGYYPQIKDGIRLSKTDHDQMDQFVKKSSGKTVRRSMSKLLHGKSPQNVNLSINDYFENHSTSELEPITHLKYYNAIDMETGKRKLIIAAAVERGIISMHGVSGFRAHERHHYETIEDIAPLNWGHNCPPYCSLDEERAFLP